MEKSIWLYAMAAAVAGLGALAVLQQRELAVLRAAVASERAAAARRAESDKAAQGAARRADAAKRVAAAGTNAWGAASGRRPVGAAP